MEIAPCIHHIPCRFGPAGASVVYVTAVIPSRADDPAGVTLIDSGTAQTPLDALTSYLAKYGRDLGDVRRILNTHGDTDHAGGNGVVKAASDAEVRIHPADRRLAEDPDYQYDVEVGYWQRLLGLDEEATAPANWSRDAYRSLAQPVVADGQVVDGDEIDCGPLRLRAIHAPGHTAGSVCYYWPEGRLLVTGDGVQGAAARPGDFPVLFDSSRYAASLEQLRALDVETLLLAHHFRGAHDQGMPVRRGDDVRVFLDDCAATAHRLADAIDAHRGLAPADLVTAVVDQLRAHLLVPEGPASFWAIPTVLSSVIPVQTR